MSQGKLLTASDDRHPAIPVKKRHAPTDAQRAREHWRKKKRKRQIARKSRAVNAARRKRGLPA